MNCGGLFKKNKQKKQPLLLTKSQKSISSLVWRGLRLCEEEEAVCVCLCVFRGRLEGCRGCGRGSQLLQTAVHVSLAALPGPGATLEAELPQILLEVLVVHGPVVLRFTLCLFGGGGRARPVQSTEEPYQKNKKFPSTIMEGKLLTKCLIMKR